MTEFNPEAGGTAVVEFLTILFIGMCAYGVWHECTQYYRGWVDILKAVGITAGIILVLFGIFVVGGTFG